MHLMTTQSLTAPSPRLRAALELTIAGALWGFGFVGAVWALRVLGPLSVTGFRFAIACSVGYAIALALPKLRTSLSWEQFRLAMIPGLILSATLVLQTWGLKHTTATKSGFITTLYVLVVPFLETIWLKRNLSRLHLIFVAFALLGVALICDLHVTIRESFTSATSGEVLTGDRAKQAWNFGDLLTLGCALMASLHIMWFALISGRIGRAFTFNLHQSFWAGLLPLLLGLFLEPNAALTLSPPASDSLTEFWLKPWVGLLSLSLGSTLIAFTLQVRAQQTIPPSLASLLFLLESPFAALFAIYFLQERLTSLHWMGAALILLAVALSTLFAYEHTAHKEHEAAGPGAGAGSDLDSVQSMSSKS